jgi:hypothetical protein
LISLVVELCSYKKSSGASVRFCLRARLEDCNNGLTKGRLPWPSQLSDCCISAIICLPRVGTWHDSIDMDNLDRKCLKNVLGIVVVNHAAIYEWAPPVRNILLFMSDGPPTRNI